jgi:hypothetical protein
MSKGSLTVRELLQRLRPYGVEELPGRRGKGSETILLLPEKPGSKRGPIYTIKSHGQGTELSIPVINAILRRFGIEKDAFWK